MIVSRVYFEHSALALAGVAEASPRSAGGRDPHDVIAPGAVEGVTHLREAGLEAVILADNGSSAGLGGLVSPPVAVETRLPERPPPGTWLVTGDPERCALRSRGVRTILVGPRRPATRRPVARCDQEARDLAAAVLQILADEAMVTRR